jgi:cell division protein DivIC
MKKILRVFLCFTLLFSCGDVDKIKKLDDRITELENKMKNNVNDYNLINQSKIKNTVDDLESQKKIYIAEIKSDSIELHKLQNDPPEQEKFAREKFLIKKENEDIFIIREKENK